MRLAVITKMLLFLLFLFLSCDKNMELFPWQCNCDIESLKLSKPSSVTYRVFTHDDASVSAITYQTDSGSVTVDTPLIPFEITVQMEKGKTVELIAKGNPKKGNIVLTYEVQGHEDINAMSSSVSRIWVMKDGSCQ